MSEGEGQDATHGEKTIELRVRLWTDHLAPTEGQILPKHAWDSGTVDLPVNHSHGIASGEPVTFNSLSELPAAVEEALISRSITIHRDKRSAKWLA